MPHKKTQITIALLDGFLAVTALVGATMVIPTLPRGWLAGTVFAGDYLVPALALGVIVAGSALVAMVTVLFWSRLGGAMATLSALMIVGFEVVEMSVVSFHWLQAAYLVLGFAIAVLGLRLWAVEGGHIPSFGRRHTAT